MDFAKLNGLIPAVIQDDETKDVLMVGFMNDEALARTREGGYAVFYSRTRQRLWLKGETSGNRLRVVSIRVEDHPGADQDSNGVADWADRWLGSFRIDGLAGFVVYLGLDAPPEEKG